MDEQTMRPPALVMTGCLLLMPFRPNSGGSPYPGLGPGGSGLAMASCGRIARSEVRCALWLVAEPRGALCALCLVRCAHSVHAQCPLNA